MGHAGNGGVGGHLAAAGGKDDLRFGAQRTAGKQPLDAACSRAPSRQARGRGDRVEARTDPPLATQRLLRGFLQCCRKACVRRQVSRGRADETDRIGLRALADPGDDGFGDIRMRRLRNQHDAVGLRIRVERVDRHQRRNAADLLFEIAPADADGMGNPLACLGDETRHLLRAGAGRADDADPAALHLVGESKRRTADDRGSAIRPHHQKTNLAGLLLQRQFIRQRDIVAEQQHVEAAVQRLARFGGCEFAGNGNQRQVCSRQSLDGGCESARPPCRLARC